MYLYRNLKRKPNTIANSQYSSKHTQVIVNNNSNNNSACKSPLRTRACESTAELTSSPRTDVNVHPASLEIMCSQRVEFLSCYCFL